MTKHNDFRKHVRNIIMTEFASHTEDIESKAHIPDWIISRMGELGWYGINIPKQYGGMGRSHMERVILIEEAGRVSGALGGALQSGILVLQLFFKL